MRALILVLAGCAPAVVPPVTSPVAAPAATPPPTPPPPPPLPPLPSSASTCSETTLHVHTRLEGPRLVDGTTVFVEPPGTGALYTLGFTAPPTPEGWVTLANTGGGVPRDTPPTVTIRVEDVVRAPRERVVLAAEPGGSIAADSGTPRVELAAGAPLRVVEVRADAVRVALVGAEVSAQGWLPTTRLGGSWSICDYPYVAPNRTVRGRARVRERPDGRVLAELAAETTVTAVASDAPPGWVRVVAVGESSWVDGYVTEAELAKR